MSDAISFLHQYTIIVHSTRLHKGSFIHRIYRGDIQRFNHPLDSPLLNPACLSMGYLVPTTSAALLYDSLVFPGCDYKK